MRLCFVYMCVFACGVCVVLCVHMLCNNCVSAVCVYCTSTVILFLTIFYEVGHTILQPEVDRQ